MNSDDQVSVVIPVYNGAPYLGEAIESVLTQTMRPSAILVVDDGSEDETPDVAAAFGSSVQYIKQPHSGLACARNTGVRHVNTDFITFLDSDDVWLTDKLEKQLAMLHSCADPAMIFARVVQFVSPDLSPHEVATVKVDETPMDGLFASALLMRTSLLREIGLFNVRLQIGEFIEWYARSKDKGVATCVLPEVLVRRRVHRTNLGRRRRQADGDYPRALKIVLDRRKQLLRGRTRGD